MSEGFHVHGAHDHVLEHAAETGHADSFAGRIAVMTAILSTAGAIFGYQGGATQNEALLAKNEAAIHKTEAANRWAYYQAKGQKQAIAELTALETVKMAVQVNGKLRGTIEIAPNAEIGPRRRLIRFVPDRPGHDFRYAMDPSGAEAALGWKARYDFEAGLDQTIRWYLDNEAWWRPIRDKRYAGQRLGGVKS